MCFLLFLEYFTTDGYFCHPFFNMTRKQFTESKYTIKNEIQKSSRLYCKDKMTEGNYIQYNKINNIYLRG